MEIQHSSDGMPRVSALTVVGSHQRDACSLRLVEMQINDNVFNAGGFAAPSFTYTTDLNIQVNDLHLN